MFSGYDPETGTLRHVHAGSTRASRSRRGRQRDDCRTAATARASTTQSRQARGAGHEMGGHGASPARTPRCSGTRRCSTRAACSRCSSGTTPATRRRWSRETCGVPAEAFLEVCEAVTENSGRDRTTRWVYSVGWTHHTVGVQYIRGSAIIQLLLGNMGRPGGGILALRGHASIQGSTDIPTLFNLLPGYLPMPKAGEHDNLDDYVATITSPTQKGFWADARKPTPSACSSPTGATRRPPTTTSPSTTCRG